jgi:hypothetical protein
MHIYDTDAETHEQPLDDADADAEPPSVYSSDLSRTFGSIWSKGAQMHVSEDKRECTPTPRLDILHSVALSNSDCGKTPTQQTSQMVTPIQSVATYPETIHQFSPLHIASVKMESQLLTADIIKVVTKKNIRKQDTKASFPSCISERVKRKAINKHCLSTSKNKQTKKQKTTHTNDMFVVETIKGLKYTNGIAMFLLGWEGYNSSHDTWEPLSNLLNCEALLSQFLKDHYPPVSDISK